MMQREKMEGSAAAAAASGGGCRVLGYHAECSSWCRRVDRLHQVAGMLEALQVRTARVFHAPFFPAAAAQPCGTCSPPSPSLIISLNHHKHRLQCPDRFFFFFAAMSPGNSTLQASAAPPEVIGEP